VNNIGNHVIVVAVKVIMMIYLKKIHCGMILVIQRNVMNVKVREVFGSVLEVVIRKANIILLILNDPRR